VSEEVSVTGFEWSSRRRLAAAVVLVAVVGLVAWLLLGGDGDEPESAGAPQAAGVEQLRDLAASVGHDVYWAGPAGAGTELELTHGADGRIFVRYLSGDGEVGDTRPRFTTIATYPVPAALAALRKEADGPDAITRTLPGGGLAYLNADQPTSVYLAWPGSDYEVEVFDPSPKHALDLVLKGAIVPVR
jgi:hypothetical protein